MSITVNFRCDGCFATTEGTRCLKRKFVSVLGKSHGFGSYEYDTPQDVAPKGWIAFDSFTGCCYCPECWNEIVKGGDVE